MTQQAVNNLAAQIAAEQAAIANAPSVESAGMVGRCHFCGAVGEIFPAHDALTHPSGSIVIERFKGRCCGGG